MMKIYPLSKSKQLPVTQKICCGIDLGTTYTLMAVVDSKNVNFGESSRIPVQFVRISQSSPNPYESIIEDEKVASIVALIDKKLYVGNNLYHLKGKKNCEYKHNIFYHWKVEMGVEQHLMYPDAIDDKLDMPYKIAGLIMKYMKSQYLQSSGEKSLNNTIISVPASFQVNQRADTIKAAEIAGIDTHSPMLIDEPNAAFLGYFNRLPEIEKQKWANEVRNKNILVVDFGGGTLDLSILNVDFRSDTGITIGNRAISRYSDLGGQDIDQLIAEEFLYPLFLKKHNILENLSLQDTQQYILPQLAVLGENLKKGICEKLSLKACEKDVQNLALDEIYFELLDCSIEHKNAIWALENVRISGDEFDNIFKKIFTGKSYSFKLTDKTVSGISKSITDVVEKTDLQLDEIDYVLYVGGSSFNPFLQSYASKKLTNSKPLISSEPDKMVAEGTAVYSYFYHVLGVSLINPITSDTIGVRMKDNKFQPIIEGGHSIPIDVELPDFRIQSEEQKEIIVPICINGSDFPIGEIRCSLEDSYPVDSEIVIKASLNRDKLFEVSVYINNEFLASAQIDNPYSIGKVSEDQLDILKLKSRINIAKRNKNKTDEKRHIRELIYKHFHVNNNLGVVQTAEEYIRKFDDNDANVWNMIYCGNSGLGRLAAATAGLKKAMEIDPEESSYIYNYALILERDSESKALEFLENQATTVKEDPTVRMKIVLLKDELEIVCESEAQSIISFYKKSPYAFSDFDKGLLLPKIFKLVGESFSYVRPVADNKEDESSSYLDRKTAIAKD
jgi:molecular chaperone DnaK